MNTYVGDCICFSELVDCRIEDGHNEDERPVCKVYKKPCRAPDWSRKLYPSRSQRSKEVDQVEPEFQSPRGFLGGAPETLLLTHAPEKGDTAAATGQPVQAKAAANCNHTVGKAGWQSWVNYIAIGHW